MPIRNPVCARLMTKSCETALAGAHPKNAWLDLTIRSEKPIRSARVHSQEQVSKNRWHQDVRLTSAKDVDAEVVSWLKSAYALAGASKPLRLLSAKLPDSPCPFAASARAWIEPPCAARMLERIDRLDNSVSEQFRLVEALPVARVRQANALQARPRKPG